MTSTPRLPRTTAPLTAALPTVTRVAAAIPTTQPARIELSNMLRENMIRVQLVACATPKETGAVVAAALEFDTTPARRSTSDKSVELSWTGDIDGWTVVIIAAQYSYDLNAPAMEV